MKNICRNKMCIRDRTRRMERLTDEKDTVWRVGKKDLWQNSHYAVSYTHLHSATEHRHTQESLRVLTV